MQNLTALLKEQFAKSAELEAEIKKNLGDWGMSDWKEYTLEELCDFQNGFAFKNSDYVDSSENTNEVFRMGYINRGGGFKEDTTPVFVPQNYPKI